MPTSAVAKSPGLAVVFPWAVPIPWHLRRPAESNREDPQDAPTRSFLTYHEQKKMEFICSMKTRQEELYIRIPSSFLPRPKGRILSPGCQPTEAWGLMIAPIELSFL